MEEDTLTGLILSNSTNSTANSMPSMPHRKLTGLELFQFYFTPVLVYLGTVGNGVSVYVFFATKLRKLSSSYYLAALTISDNIFLASLFVVWLRMVEVDIFNKPGMCHIIVYLTGVSSFLSVWLVLAFTVERFVAVRHPLLRQSVCTVSRAKTTIAVLVFIAMALYIPSPIFASVKSERGSEICTVDPEWHEVINIFNYFDTVVTFVVPVVVIIVLNVCISRTIWKLASVRRRLTYRGAASQGGRKGVVRASNIRIRPRPNASAQNKVTKMLLVVSTVCLCLNFPSYVMRVLADLIQLGVIENIDIPSFVTIQHYCQQLYYTNFGINFVLYCISGQNFRKALRSLRCLRKRLRRHEFIALTESRTQSSVSSATSKKKRLPNFTDSRETTTNSTKLSHINETSSTDK